MRKFIIITLSFLLNITINSIASSTTQKVIRIGYLEGGPYWAYTKVYEAFKKSLIKKAAGYRIVFVKNAHFSPGWGKEHEADYIRCAKELMNREDINFVIAMGTAATAALLKVNNYKKPIMAMWVADPLGAGFVKNLDDSGIDNFTTRIIPNRWKIMFEIFYDVVHFKKLGIIYSNTKEGMMYSNVHEAREVAKEKGFKLVEYNKISPAETVPECKKGIEYLVSKGIDAFFIPSLVCFDWTKSNVEVLMNELIRDKIPTFARDGSPYVKAGALMGFAAVDFDEVGDFFANNAVKIFKGAKPRDLNMIDRPSPKIAVNLETALKIGFDFPITILIASDEIYNKIIYPSNRKFK